MRYPFPGNIRELENIIERSVALENSSIILPESLIIAGDGNGTAGPGQTVDFSRDGERGRGREVMKGSRR
jgi:transcriptional regulator with PAS, ATPase and Fis domain